MAEDGRTSWTGVHAAVRRTGNGTCPTVCCAGRAPRGVARVRRSNAAASTSTTSLVTPSDAGMALDDARMAALRSGATEILAQFSGAPVYSTNSRTCVVASVDLMAGASCTSFTTHAAVPLTADLWAHHENSGCSWSGSDYSSFGYDASERNYLSANAGIKFFRPCDESAYLSGTVQEYPSAGIYLRHGAAPSTFHCTSGPGGACYTASTSCFGSCASAGNWASPTYTNDFASFRAYCASWSANGGLFHGGLGPCP